MSITKPVRTLPPEGWHCTRAPGHEGPCAASTTAQQRFDEQYISSLEIGERMQVSRPAVMHARRRGVLPEPVCVNDGQIYIWERKEVEPYLKAWENSVKMRRGQPVVVQTGPGTSAFPFAQPTRADE